MKAMARPIPSPTNMPPIQMASPTDWSPRATNQETAAETTRIPKSVRVRTNTSSRVIARPSPVVTGGVPYPPYDVVA